MNTRKGILASLLMVGIIAMAAGMGTYAYFSDVETSTGNTFTAGTIDLVIDSTTGQAVKTVTGELDLKPCQVGYIENNLTNNGTNPIDVWKHIYNVVDDENGVTQPEEEYYKDNPNSECRNISRYIHYDMASKECNIDESEGYYLSGCSDKIIECEWMYLGRMNPGESMVVIQSYHLDATVDNWGQSDRVTFDIEFVAQQIENPNPPGTELLRCKR